MSNPWDGTPSIWDGWTGQCFGIQRWRDQETNADLYCAVGYVNEFDVLWIGREEVRRRVRAASAWLSRNDYLGVTAANDAFHWTPEQFRDLDRRLEWEYQQARLQKQIDAIEPNVLAAV